MTIQDNAILLDRLAGALDAITLSLRETSNLIGRSYHNRAIDMIRKIMRELDALMRADHAMAQASGEAAMEAASEALLEATLRYEMGDYLSEPIHLGDHIIIDAGTNEFKIFPYGSWMPVYDNMPVATPIANCQMESLYENLEALEAGTGIQITAYHIAFHPTRCDE